MTTVLSRLLIIDDHPVLLYGLRLLLEDHPRFAICGEAVTADDARAQAETLQPDFIIADLVLGGRDGIALIEDLATISRARILVYSSHDELVHARPALRAGASGYVSKSEGLDSVESALRRIAAGDIAISPAVQALPIRDTGDAPPAVSGLQGLSARELQVLDLVGKGIDLPGMARALGLSTKTIGTYRDRLKMKLGLDSLRALERYADDHVTQRRSARS